MGKVILGPGVVVRMGAAAFAVGLSLAGPAPSAMADEIDGRGSAANIRSEATGSEAEGSEVKGPEASGPPPRAIERRPAGPSRRGTAAKSPAESAGTVSSARGRGAARGVAAMPVDDSGPPATSPEPPTAPRSAAPAGLTPAGRDLPPAASAVAATGPSTFGGDASVGVPVDVSVHLGARVGVVSPQPAAAIAAAQGDSCGSCWALGSVGAPALGERLTGLSFAVARVMDTVGQWLSGLPFTDFLSGALWLVRRTLFPVGSGVGLFGTAACVATKDCSGQDLSGADLSGAVLDQVDFTDAILDRADLSKAVLASQDSAAQMAGTSLFRADLAGATLGVSGRGVNLTDADLENAFFGPALFGLPVTAITDVNFTGANLDGANLARSYRKAVTDADMRSATWIGANLSGQNFSRGWNLAGINLTKTTLSGVRFGGATLTGANFTEATLTGLLGARNADFTGVSDADLVSAVWTGANLTTLDFSNRDLRNINWGAFADQPRVNLAGAVLNNTRLDDAWLLNADLGGAVLTNSDLSGVQAAGANFFNANLNGVDFTNADLSNADLRGAQVQGVTWTNCTCPDGELAPDSGCVG